MMNSPAMTEYGIFRCCLCTLLSSVVAEVIFPVDFMDRSIPIAYVFYEFHLLQVPTLIHIFNYSWQCDYEIDCSNGEDELHDAAGNSCLPCSERGYLCHDDANRCIPPQWKCDGWTDCSGGDDEKFCSTCSNTQFTCSDGKCISLDLLCDGQQDCFNGEDENLDQNGNECTVATKRPQNESQSQSPTATNIHNDHSPITPSPVMDPSINVIDWKYCPSDITWLGFVNSFQSENNQTKVWWIEPKLRDEGTFYQKWSTESMSPGALFGVGLHTVEYLGKRIQHNGSRNVTDDPIFCDVTILVLGIHNNKCIDRLTPCKRMPFLIDCHLIDDVAYGPRWNA